MLVQHPDIQARLYHEISSMIGERLPSIADIKDLPYLQAVIAEVLFYLGDYLPFIYLSQGPSLSHGYTYGHTAYEHGRH
jgi:hypothetical protein